MAFDPKEIKRVARACREAGIKHYKCADYEITLSDYAPEPPKPRGRHVRAASAAPEEKPERITSDAQLSEEQLLFYSTADIPESTPGSDT